MESLSSMLRRAMTAYAGPALNGSSYLTVDDSQQVFTVISVGHFDGRRVVDTGLVARVEGNHIVIEHDANDKPLVDALAQMGIPRSQITLAYLHDQPQPAADIERMRDNEDSTP